MRLVVEILGVWTGLALIAGALIGPAIRVGRGAPVRARPPFPLGRALSAAAAGSAVAAFGVFAVAAQSLRDGVPKPDVVTLATAEPVVQPAPETTRAAAPPTSLQDLTDPAPRGRSVDLSRLGEHLDVGGGTRAPGTEAPAASGQQAGAGGDVSIPLGDAPPDPASPASGAPAPAASGADDAAQPEGSGDSSRRTHVTSTPRRVGQPRHRRHSREREPSGQEPPQGSGGTDGQSEPDQSGADAQSGTRHRLPLPDLLGGGGLQDR
jgi:hypothetical protein